MKKYSFSLIYVLALVSFGVFVVSCKSDSKSNTPTLLFAGKYAITGAVTVGASPTDVLAALGGLLLAGSPCDTTGHPTNAPLIQLKDSLNNSSGSVNIVCTATSASQPDGTWTFAQPNGPLNLNLNVSGVGTIPFTLTNLNITASTDGTVNNIVGQINLSAFQAQLPALKDPVQLTINRVP